MISNASQEWPAPQRSDSPSFPSLPSLITALTLSLGAVVHNPSPVAAQDRPENPKLLERLKAAWDARIQKFDSAKFEWTETRQFHPGSIIPASIAAEMGMEGPPAQHGWPLKIREANLPRELTVQGHWMRHLSRSVGPSDDLSRLEFSEYISTYDGDSSRMMSTDADGSFGSIRVENRNTDAAEISLRPLLYFLRPFQKAYGLLKRESLAIEDEPDDGGELVVTANASRRFVIDPNRDFVIVAWTQGNPRLGGKLHEGRVEYRQHENLGWVPHVWELSHFEPADPSQLLERYSGSVTHVEAGVVYEKSLFRLEFPVQAQVYDHLTGEEFVVQPDGSRRDVSLVTRRGVPVQEGEAAQNQSRPVPVVWLVIANLVVLVVLFALVWIHKRRSADHWHAPHGKTDR